MASFNALNFPKSAKNPYDPRVDMTAQNGKFWGVDKDMPKTNTPESLHWYTQSIRWLPPTRVHAGPAGGPSPYTNENVGRAEDFDGFFNNSAKIPARLVVQTPLPTPGKVTL
jgi:hypothetical protein